MIGNGQESKEALAIVTGLMEPSVAVGNLLGSVFAGWVLQVFNYTIGVSVNAVQLGLIVMLQSSLLIAERCTRQRLASQQNDNVGDGVDAAASTQRRYGALCSTISSKVL